MINAMEATSASIVTSSAASSTSPVSDPAPLVRFDLENPNAWEARARVLQQLGRTEEAIASLKHAVHLTHSDEEG